MKQYFRRNSGPWYLQSIFSGLVPRSWTRRGAKRGPNKLELSKGYTETPPSVLWFRPSFEPLDIQFGGVTRLLFYVRPDRTTDGGTTLGHTKYLDLLIYRVVKYVSGRVLVLHCEFRRYVMRTLERVLTPRPLASNRSWERPLRYLSHTTPLWMKNWTRIGGRDTRSRMEETRSRRIRPITPPEVTVTIRVSGSYSNFTLPNTHFSKTFNVSTPEQ